MFNRRFRLLVQWALVSGSSLFATVAIAGPPASVERAQEAGLEVSTPRGAPQARAPAATLPIRWRLPNAVEETGTRNTFCATTVLVVNTTASSVEVQVEFHDDSFGSLGLVSLTIDPYEQGAVATDLEVSNNPWLVNSEADLDDFDGYALVAADDPRIIATGVIYCRDGLDDQAGLVSLLDVPAIPVGTTLDWFSASRPATPRPTLRGSPRGAGSE